MTTLRQGVLITVQIRHRQSRVLQGDSVTGCGSFLANGLVRIRGGERHEFPNKNPETEPSDRAGAEC